MKVRAPASIANIGPGFDVLAFAVKGLHDIVEVEVLEGRGLVRVEVEGLEVPSGRDNVVYRVAESFIKRHGLSDIDINIKLTKGVPPSSGLGSSGASSAATAYALVQLFGKEVKDFELVKLAAEGEAMVAGTPHYDNVAASLFGGVVLLDLLRERVYRLRPPIPIYVAVVVPKNVVKHDKKTGVARAVLPKSIDLETHVKQSSAVAKLVYALQSGDVELLGEAVSVDLIAEPYRSKLIPYYYELKEMALKLGALGFNICGAGPSVFSVYRSYEEALKVGEKLIGYLKDRGLYSDLIVTEISEKGAEAVG